MFGFGKRNDPPARVEPEVTQAHKDAAMTDMFADMIGDGLTTYIRHAVFEWKDIEGLAPQQAQNDAAIAVSAFKAGFVVTAVSYLKAGTFEIDFEQHPEFPTFAADVLRVVFKREHGDDGEEWMKGVVCEGQKDGTCAGHAYKAGNDEGWNFAETIMFERNVLNRDALKEVLLSIWSRKAETEALRAAAVERNRATVQ